jgi:hypothetical protein
MGGLVTKKVRFVPVIAGAVRHRTDRKKAYLLARRNPIYQEFAGRIHSMYFLATPHRGADTAQTLARLLASSIFYGSKTFVSELSPKSAMLQVRHLDK